MTEIEITELFGPRCAEFDAGCTSCYVWRAYDEIKRLTYERDALFGKLAEVLDHE